MINPDYYYPQVQAGDNIIRPVLTTGSICRTQDGDLIFSGNCPAGETWIVGSPGGKHAPKIDRSLEETMLREYQEELGLEANEFEFVKKSSSGGIAKVTTSPLYAEGWNLLDELPYAPGRNPETLILQGAVPERLSLAAVFRTYLLREPIPTDDNPLLFRVSTASLKRLQEQARSSTTLSEVRNLGIQEESLRKISPEAKIVFVGAAGAIIMNQIKI